MDALYPLLMTPQKDIPVWPQDCAPEPWRTRAVSFLLCCTPTPTTQGHTPQVDGVVVTAMATNLRWDLPPEIRRIIVTITFLDKIELTCEGLWQACSGQYIEAVQSLLDAAVCDIDFPLPGVLLSLLIPGKGLNFFKEAFSPLILLRYEELGLSALTYSKEEIQRCLNRACERYEGKHFLQLLFFTRLKNFFQEPGSDFEDFLHYSVPPEYRLFFIQALLEPIFLAVLFHRKSPDFEFLAKAAVARGHAGAEFILGMFYKISGSKSKFLKHLRRAADLGSKEAMSQLACALFCGDYTLERDVAAADILFHNVILMGAGYSLTEAVQSSCASDPDRTSLSDHIIGLLLSAADKGDVRSIGALGVLYRDGNGVPGVDDINKAIIYFEKAVALGSTELREELEDLLFFRKRFIWPVPGGTLAEILAEEIRSACEMEAQQQCETRQARNSCTTEEPHFPTNQVFSEPCNAGEGHTVVIDIGSHSSKFGYAGYEAPMAYHRYDGDYASNAVDRGVIQNWEEVENVLRKGYKKLRAEPTDQPVLLTQYVNTTKESGAKMAEIMFECFKVPALYFASQHALALMAHGTTTGIAVDVGHGAIQCVPVIDGTPVQGRVLKFGGKDITDYLHSFDSLMCRILWTGCPQLSYIENLKIEKASVMYFPSGTTKEPSCAPNELTQCMELLYDPCLLFGAQTEHVGLHTAVWDVINTFTDTSIQTNLLGNIVPCGGTCNAPGFDERLKQELEGIFGPTQMNIQVVPPDARSRAHSAWIGGSTLCSLPVFEDMLLPRSFYEEYGPTGVTNESWMVRWQ
ncbi:actin family [Pelomyxa schiedti]|nr:actin family [Pelomyxa schiedti]